MKDIKLTIEEIKKGCEFADGFEWVKGWIHHGRFKFSINDIDKVNIDLRFQETVYPLFLQRVIEGINKNPMKIDEPHFRIRMNCDIDNQWYEVSHGRVLADGHSYITFMFKNNDPIDQAKTKAIKYILDKLK